MTALLGLVLAAILSIIACLHLYWACGGQWGIDAVIPSVMTVENDSITKPIFRPGPIATTAVAILLLVAALVSLDAANMIQTLLPNTFVKVSIWMIASVFFLRGFGDFRYLGLTKRVHGTLFAKMDSLLFTPLCFLLSLLAFAVAMNST